MTNPVDSLLEQQSAKRDRHSIGHDLHRAWSEGGKTPELMDPLLDHYAHVARTAVQKYIGANVPKSAALDKAHESMIKAIHAWQPGRGANLETLMTHYTKGLYRYNGQQNNLVRKPEEVEQRIGPIQAAQEFLKNEHPGVEPTVDQIHQHIRQNNPGLKMTKPQVQQTLKALGREMPSSSFESDFQARLPQRIEELKPLIPLMQNTPFTPDEMTVFHHMEGLHGHQQTTSTGEIARRMGKSSSQVSKMRSSMEQKLEDMIRRRTE